MAFRCLTALLGLMLAAPLWGAEVDPNSPKGAMKRFYEATEAGDAVAVRSNFHAATDDEKALADVYAVQLTAAKALGEAAKTKFAAGGDALTKGLPVRDEIARLDAAEVHVDGDVATVKLAGQARAVRMVKSDGQWRVAIADYAGATPEGVVAQTAVLKDMAGVFQTVAADILADKFPSAAEAQRALQQKLQAVVFNTLQKNPPTTAKSPPVKPKP